MGTLASDWLRHFRLLLWNLSTEFNETWQEARSQRHLPSSCFSGRSEKQDGRPGQSAKKVAHCTQVHDMWPFGPLVTDLILFMQVTHGLDSAITLDHISVVYAGFEQNIGTVYSVISRTTPATGRSNVLTAITGARERTTCRVILAGYIKIYSESS